MIKHSKQRDAIMKVLMATKEHPSADTIYMKVREDYPNISLGTVYRNLNMLSESGEIRRISGQGGVDRFDANTKKHTHFFCIKCDSIIDLNEENEEMEEDGAVDELMQKQTHFDGRITGHITQFYGYCPRCLSSI